MDVSALSDAFNEGKCHELFLKRHLKLNHTIPDSLDLLQLSDKSETSLGNPAPSRCSVEDNFIFVRACSSPLRSPPLLHAVINVYENQRGHGMTLTHIHQIDINSTLQLQIPPSRTLKLNCHPLRSYK